MTARVAEGENPATNPPIGEIFAKNYAKLYIPVVSLSTGDDNKSLQQLKSEFKRTVKWNKYISEMNNQAKTLHEKQHFRKNAQRKYHIFLIFRN